METNDFRELLEQVQAGRLSVDEALARAAQAPVVNRGFAHVDLQRRERCGFPEVIFCQGKTCAWIESVVQKLMEAGQDCLATRVSDEQAEHLGQLFPQADQDRVARTFWLPVKKRAALGRAAVITACPSDLPVAQAAARPARAVGRAATL